MSGPSIRTVDVDGLLQPPTESYSPATPTTSFHTPLSTPATIRRELSEEDTRSNAMTEYTIHPGPPPKPPPRATATDTTQAALLQSARIKLSSRDQEAMRKLRSTMMEHSDSGSSNSASPLSPRFPPGSQSSYKELRPRRSTLSRQVTTSPEAIAQNQSSLDSAFADSTGERTPQLNNTFSEPTASLAESPDWVIAVVGHAGVGKSTVIGRALKTWGMSNPVTIQSPEGHTISSCITNVEPGGKLKDFWKVEFLEMDIETLNLASQATNIWPSSAHRVTGAVFCYDATRESTLGGLNRAIARLAADSLPMVILACKSDPDTTVEVNAPYGNSIGEPYNVGLIEVTTKTPEGKSKMRNALRWLLYKLEQRQRRQQRKLASVITIPQGLPSPPIASATIEALITPAESDASSSAPDRLMWRQGVTMTPAEGGNADTASDHRSSSSSFNWMNKGPLQNAIAAPGEPKEEPKVDGDGQLSEKAGAVAILAGDPPVYASLEDLFNQLFTAIVSTQDDAFIRAFFMTYRRFCKPNQLMEEFLSRIREIEEYAVSTDTKNWALMKLTGAMIDWTTRYSGDLAHTTAQTTFRIILAIILKYTFMAHLTADLVGVEQSLIDVVDLDESWSMREPGSATRAGSTKSRLSNSGTELLLDGEVLYELDESSLSRSEHNHDGSLSKEQTPSSHSMSTSSLNFDNDPLARRTASSSEPRLTNTSSVSSDDKLVHSFSSDANADQSLTKAVHMVLVMDARSFATELTRMQSELFSAIRPRDIFRHDFGKEIQGPVGKSILFFNHLSRWASTMILAHQKPKHRARVFERFMLIAHQLRRLNNYDTLYALLSGMQEASVHRLSQTHALVQLPPSVEKEHQSHIKLLDPRGGYIHYRRALEADLAHGRPAIPLLTSILGLINRLQTVRPEDIRQDDSKIQWDKFARFGEILSAISDCQARGPIVRGAVSPSFKKMIEDTPIIVSEDGLWARSQILEPSGGTVGGKVLKRLANLGFAAI